MSQVAAVLGDVCATLAEEDAEDGAVGNHAEAVSGDGPGDEDKAHDAPAPEEGEEEDGATAVAEVASERACFCLPPPVSNAAALADRRAGVHDCAGQAIPR